MAKEKTVKEYLDGRTPERKARSKNLKEKVLTMVPTMVQGSHLTVLTFPDGRTELKWDDEALLRDVRAAILRAESTIPATTTEVTKPRKASAITAGKKSK
jgi:hypothetical protein